MKDTSYEKTLWNARVMTILTFIGGFFLAWCVYELMLWYLAGYWKPGEFDVTSPYGPQRGIVILGFGETLLSSLVGGVTVGGCGALIITKSYVHPITLINRKKRDLPEQTNDTGFVGENEFIIRGARMKNGPWPAILVQAEKDAFKAAEHLKERYGIVGKGN